MTQRFKPKKTYPGREIRTIKIKGALAKRKRDERKARPKRAMRKINY